MTEQNKEEEDIDERDFKQRRMFSIHNDKFFQNLKEDAFAHKFIEGIQSNS